MFRSVIKKVLNLGDILVFTKNFCYAKLRFLLKIDSKIIQDYFSNNKVRKLNIGGGGLFRIKKLANSLYRQAIIIKHIRLKSYIKYSIKSKNGLALVEINNFPVFVRKGTPDIDVAISCLNGEFEALKFLYGKDFDGVIVDAGGYIGTAAIALNHIFPQANIITIEPSPENMEVLKRNVEDIKKIQTIFGALISADDKKISLMDRGTGEWGHTVVRNPQDKEDAKVICETPAVNLSSLGVAVEEIGILKLDIEGGEYDLFINDSASLLKIPNIIVELHDRIINGCSEEFFKFSKDRIIIKTASEKFLSISKSVGL